MTTDKVESDWQKYNRLQKERYAAAGALNLAQGEHERATARLQDFLETLAFRKGKSEVCSECAGGGEIGLVDGEVPCPKCFGSGDPSKPGVFAPMFMMKSEPLPVDKIWDESPKGCWSPHPVSRGFCKLPNDGHEVHKRKHPNGVELECWRDSSLSRAKA